MAQRFHFRLETVLHVRTLREREAKRRVGAKRSEIGTLDRLDDETRTSIREQEADLLATQSRPSLDPRHIVRGRAWIAHLRSTIAQRQLLRARLTDDLLRLQDELRDARSQTKIIEKLRERRWIEHRAKTARVEQRRGDEMAQMLHIRKSLETQTAPMGAEV